MAKIALLNSTENGMLSVKSSRYHSRFVELPLRYWCKPHKGLAGDSVGDTSGRFVLQETAKV
ncbi:MAG: hypothetical protein DMG88_18570 [Acidobacteria bacterium]|nr:MAG: hypothetical protein DMG88_18570 [Acidobacteriota bacterium]